MNFQDVTILIVDDEPDLREAIAFDFKRKGYNVLTAGSGREALAMLETKPVHLVLSDVRMPNGDGIELLDKIKEKNTLLPVVMLITGFSDISLEEAYDKGADAVFAKPFDRKALHEAVARALQPADERFLRREVRVVADLPVKLKFLKSDVSVDSRILNIGRGGIFCTLTDEFPSALEQVDFNLDTSLVPVPRISGLGVVRWVRRTDAEGFPKGCGIELINLDSECLVKVVELINFLKTKSFIPRR